MMKKSYRKHSAKRRIRAFGKISAVIFISLIMLLSLAAELTEEVSAGGYTVSSGYIVKGSTNTSGKFYTWHMLEAGDDLSEIIKKYGKAYGADGNGDIGLPIMLIDASNGWAYIQSPGEANQGYYYQDKGWKWRVGGCDVNTGSYQSWKGLAGSTNNLEGATFEIGESFVTRGLLNCWFVTNDAEYYESFKGESDTMSYQLHTWAYETDSSGNKTGEIVMSEKMLGDSYSEKNSYGIQIGFFKAGEGYSRHTSVVKQPTGMEVSLTALNSYGTNIKETCCWKIQAQSSTSSYFLIRRSHISFYTGNDWNWETYYKYLHTLTIKRSDGDRLYVHENENKSILWYKKDKKWSDWQDLSSDYEAQGDQFFKIYYATEGIPTDEADAVSGDTYVTKEEGTSYITSETLSQNINLTGTTNCTVNSGSSYAVPENTIKYIPEGTTLTVEKGATLVIGANGYLVNNGTIVNNGNIIIEPGGMLIDWDCPQTSGVGTDAVAQGGILQGSGNMIIRTGGKVRQKSITLSGYVRNQGALIAVDIYTPGKRVELYKNANIGYNCVANYWFWTASDVNSRMTNYHYTAGANISANSSTKYIYKNNAVLYASSKIGKTY